MLLLISRLKKLMILGVLFSCVPLAVVLDPQNLRANNWIFFDVGETLITGNSSAGFRYLEGAHDALRRYKEAGFHLALISNVPDTWGTTCLQKKHRYKEVLSSLWKDTSPFAWEIFDAVILPPTDSYQKPHPLMFLNGLRIACPSRALFMGESSTEVTAAQKLGYATILKDPGSNQWPSPVDIESAMNLNYRHVAPSNCDYQSLMQSTLSAGDQLSHLDLCH